MFRVLETSRFLHEIPEIKEIWDACYSQEKDDIYGTCLVTGTVQPIARIHNSVKGIRSDSLSPNGWTLVGFDKAAFCSYGKEQSYNAPVGKYAAFAYTTALNYLLSDRGNVQHIGDTTVVCWAEGAEPQYQDTFRSIFFDKEVPEGLKDSDLRSAVKRLANGLPYDELKLDPARPFYILGLAPNAARLSVRFFLRDTFGNLMKNINAHHERMEIVRPKTDPYSTLPLWAMLRETVNMKSRDKAPSMKSWDKALSPVMAGAVARAIFTGGLYPASLLEAVMLRLRAERDITPGRAAIIKAYYLKNENPLVPKEVLQVSLHEQSTNIPYTLGRLFSVLEDIQLRANPGINATTPGINATIKDKYFNSAASTPAMIFPLLNNLSEKHLRKLETGWRIHYEKQLYAVMGILPESYPPRLTLPEQGAFYLGYYHQTQKRYEK